MRNRGAFESLTSGQPPCKVQQREKTRQKAKIQSERAKQRDGGQVNLTPYFSQI